MMAVGRSFAAIKRILRERVVENKMTIVVTSGTSLSIRIPPSSDQVTLHNLYNV